MAVTMVWSDVAEMGSRNATCGAYGRDMGSDIEGDAAITGSVASRVGAAGCTYRDQLGMARNSQPALAGTAGFRTRFASSEDRRRTVFLRITSNGRSK